MYYIQTADRLTRTSVWLEKMEGGIEYLRDVIVNDRLGICDELERQMQFLVDTYQCEWTEVVNDPEKRRLFKQFVNTDETEPTIEFVKEREQQAAGGLDDAVSFRSNELTVRGAATSGAKAPAAPEPVEPELRWVQVGKVWDFPHDGGATIKYGKTQIAVFNFASRGEWYATQNMCPHKREFVLSRGMIGDQERQAEGRLPGPQEDVLAGDPGKCLSGEDYSVRVFPVKVDGDDVYLQLPPVEELDAVLATEKTCNGSSCQPAEAPKKRRRAKAPELLPADPYAQTL